MYIYRKRERAALMWQWAQIGMGLAHELGPTIFCSSAVPSQLCKTPLHGISLAASYPLKIALYLSLSK